ncbi:MAG: PAS domain S-box protein [Pseudomonadales bacterium]|nr:PAS domain S-box protein [Pseudomonadales bacterium]
MKPSYDELKHRVEQLEKSLQQDQAHNNHSSRENEHRYRARVDNAPVCIHEIDLDGRLVKMNPAGLKMMGMRYRRING